MSKVLHFINGDLPPFLLAQANRSEDSSQHPAVAAAIASAAPARMEFDWEHLQLRLVSRVGHVIRRWHMESVPSLPLIPSHSEAVSRGENMEDAAGTHLSSSRFFWRITEEDKTASSQKMSKKDARYVVRPAKPEEGDVWNTPHYYNTRENNYNDTDAKKQLISGVDFRSKMGRRFAVTRKEYGAVMKTAGFSAQDVMNAVEITANRRAMAEKNRERMIAAVESGESMEAPTKKKAKV